MILWQMALADWDVPSMPYTLRTYSSANCTAQGGVGAYPGEEDHVFAARLAVNTKKTFVVEQFRYSLISNLAIPECLETLEHRLDLWTQPSEFPYAAPRLVFSTTVQHPPSEFPNPFYTIDVPDFEMHAGESLYLGISMPRSHDLSQCVLVCTESPTRFSRGVGFWSQSSTTPYPWVDVLDIGLEVIPYARVDGYLLLD
jgi:hypothetical protein